MVTEPDINAIIDRVEAIIKKAGESLYDKDKKGLKGATIIRNIVQGRPKNWPTIYPTLLILPGKPLIEKAYFGSNAFYNKIRLTLELYVSNDDPVKMQYDMLAIHKLMVEALEANNGKLLNPDDSTDTTGLAKLSRAEKTDALDSVIVKPANIVVDGVAIQLLIEVTNN